MTNFIQSYFNQQNTLIGIMSIRIVDQRELGKCCQRGSNQPCNRIQSRNRTAAIDYGYIDNTVQRQRQKCCCRQAVRCACPEPPRCFFKLDIPQLPLNKSFCFPAALTSITPCSKQGYCQATAADNIMFPARYPTKEEKFCAGP